MFESLIHANERRLFNTEFILPLVMTKWNQEGRGTETVSGV